MYRRVEVKNVFKTTRYRSLIYRNAWYTTDLHHKIIQEKILVYKNISVFHLYTVSATTTSSQFLSAMTFKFHSSCKLNSQSQMNYINMWPQFPSVNWIYPVHWLRVKFSRLIEKKTWWVGELSRECRYMETQRALIALLFYWCMFAQIKLVYQCIS